MNDSCGPKTFANNNRFMNLTINKCVRIAKKKKKKEEKFNLRRVCYDFC